MKKVRRKHKRFKWIVLFQKNKTQFSLVFKKNFKNVKTLLIEWRKKIIVWKKFIKAKIILKIQYFQYRIMLNSFLFPRKILYYTRRKFQKIGLHFFTTIYFCLLVLVVIHLGKQINLSISPTEAQQFFLGSAAMVGGALAIVVSFSLFTVQQAADHLPKDFYKVATDIKKYLLIFLTDAIISIILFLYTISYGKFNFGLSALSIQIALIAIGISFYLLFLLLYKVREDVDPDKVLIKVSNGLISLVQNIYKSTKQYAKILSLHPQNRNNVSLESLIAALFQSSASKQQLNYLDTKIAYLFDYHDSLLGGYQKSAALEILEHVKGLVLQYLYIRKDSSLAFPDENAIIVLTSDSKYVLQPILERMIRLTEEYMNKEDTTGIIQTVDIFISWVSSASEIRYVGLRRRENPISEQISGYFNQLMTRAINHNSLEGMFQGLRFYNYHADLSIEKGYSHELSATLEKIEQIGFQAMKTKQEPVIQRVFNAYSDILVKMVLSENFASDVFISMLMEHIRSLTIVGYYLTIRGTMSDNMIAQQDIAKPYNRMRDLIITSANNARQATSRDKKREWQHLTMTLVEELYSSLRQLVGEIKNPNHFLILSLGNIIKDVGIFLIALSEDVSWNEHSTNILREVLSYLHLPEWLINDAKKINDNQSFDALIEAIASIGLDAVEKNKDELGHEAVKILSKFPVDMLGKEKGQGAMYVEPSIMEHACYIGIVALKHGKTQIINTLKQAISTFEERYQAVYFSNIPEGIDAYNVSPSPDKLKKDINNLLRSRQGWRRERLDLDESREKMFSKVDAQDIQNFIQTIWNN